MTIDKEEIRKIHLLISRHLKSADTVMVPKYGKITNDKLYFCSGPDDWQEFMETEPNAHGFEAVDTRDIHDILLAIDEKRMPARDFVLNGVLVKGLVDVGSILEDRAIIRDLHAVMPKINEEFQRAGELATERGSILIGEIGNNLQRLCKDDYGLTTANQLWDTYMAESVVKKPDLFIPPGDQWFAESLRQFPQIVEMRVPALFDRTIKDLALGNGTTIHLNMNNATLPVVIYASPINRTLMVDLKTSNAKDKGLSISLDTSTKSISFDQFIKILSKQQDVTRTQSPPRGDSSDGQDQNNISRGRKK